MGQYLSGNNKLNETSDNEDVFHDAQDASATSATSDILKTEMNNLETDAVESKTDRLFQNSVSTVIFTDEIIANIEQQLSLDEKISLVFLLYDSEDTALQFSLVEKENSVHNQTTSLITKWAKSNHLDEPLWKNQLLEALCIIQNYSILKKLGYDKRDLQLTYLPTNFTSYNYVNKIRKALYCLCENLTLQQTETFLSHLRKDYARLSINFQEFGSNHLEMYLLHCFSMKYIEYNDLSRLMSILKRMNLENLADNLDSIVKINAVEIQARIIINNNDDDDVNREMINAPSEETSAPKFDLNSEVKNIGKSNFIERCSDNSVIGNNSIVKVFKTGKHYEIDRDNVGHCLIINQETFYRDQNKENLLFISIEELENRTGTNVDEKRLSETFGILGFQITIVRNRSHTQMLEDIEDTMKKFTHRDSCFVVCILSHGVKDCVYGANSVRIEVSEIENKMLDKKYKALLGKPKILILQACQGLALQTTVPRSLDMYNETDGHVPKCETAVEDDGGIPEKCDMLVCWSTVPGYAAIRNKITGSWYIEDLCECILEECDTEHFVEILTSVTNKISAKRWLRPHQNGKINACMVPLYHTTLRKKLYLQKVRETS